LVMGSFIYTTGNVTAQESVLSDVYGEPLIAPQNLHGSVVDSITSILFF